MKNLICLVLFIYICLFNYIKSEAYFENTTPEMTIQFYLVVLTINWILNLKDKLPSAMLF